MFLAERLIATVFDGTRNGSNAVKLMNFINFDTDSNKTYLA